MKKVVYCNSDSHMNKFLSRTGNAFDSIIAFVNEQNAAP